MYQSQQYLDIGGKFIVSPFLEDECLYGVNLHTVLCDLHQSEAIYITDFKNIILRSISRQVGVKDTDKAVSIYKRVMVKLSELGIAPKAVPS